MAAVKSLVVLAAGAVIGAAALIAYRISQETGKSLPESLSEVPAELERLYAELKKRGADAFDKGRAAYEEKQHELADHLKEFGSARL